MSRSAIGGTIKGRSHSEQQVVKEAQPATMEIITRPTLALMLLSVVISLYSMLVFAAAAQRAMFCHVPFLSHSVCRVQRAA